MAWAYPQCLGLGMDTDALAKSLRQNYGVAGQEQFTAAIDLAQFTVRNLIKPLRTNIKKKKNAMQNNLFAN